MLTSYRFAAALLLFGAAPAHTQLPPSTASFGGAATVSVPFRTVHGLVVIPVTINGHAPLQFILDTGAPVIVIPDTALASRLGLKILGTARVGGAGDGDVQTAPLAGEIAASVGSLTVTGALGIVGVVGDVIPGVDGVIGGALFRHAAVELDWDAGMIHFHDPAKRTSSFRGDTLPLRVEASLHSYVPGTVVVNGTEMKVDLHLDTGARQPLSLAPSTMKRFSATPAVAIPTIVAFGSRGAARGDAIRASASRLGRETIENVTAYVPQREAENPARIGLPVLKHFNFIVDYPGKRLVLRPRVGQNEPFRFTTTGLVLQPGRDSVYRRVAHVIAGSPAAEAGILAGDSIVAVGGVALTSIAEENVPRSVITPNAGDTVKLTMIRAGKRDERQLVARVLLP
jgi:predicted aspartyl protease